MMRKSLTALAVIVSFAGAGTSLAANEAGMHSHDHGSQAPAPSPSAAKTDAPAAGEHIHAAPGLATKQQSDLTMIQVMQDLALQMNRIQFGIMTQNRTMIAEGAMAVANHPMPKGGLKPYLKKNKDQLQAVIPAMDATIHGSAVDMAHHAAVAPMKDIQTLYNVMAENCVSCHDVFRDQ